MVEEVIKEEVPTYIIEQINMLEKLAMDHEMKAEKLRKEVQNIKDKYNINEIFKFIEQECPTHVKKEISRLKKRKIGKTSEVIQMIDVEINSLKENIRNTKNKY